MIRTTSIFTAVFAAVAVGVSSIATATEPEPLAMVPIEEPAPITTPQLVETPRPALVPAFARPQVQPQEVQMSGVIVNDVPLSMNTVNQMRAAGMNVVEGNYWYDRTCGAFGYKGGPAVGRIMPGLNIGGPMKANCANGNSGMFVNGRELTMSEALPLAQGLRIGQGRYALDAALNFGLEGQPPVINLAAAVAAAQQQQQPERQKSLSERGLLYGQPVCVPGVGCSGEGFSYTH
jgi:hypothetical protein